MDAKVQDKTKNMNKFEIDEKIENFQDCYKTIGILENKWSNQYKLQTQKKKKITIQYKKTRNEFRSETISYLTTQSNEQKFRIFEVNQIHSFEYSVEEVDVEESRCKHFLIGFKKTILYKSVEKSIHVISSDFDKRFQEFRGKKSLLIHYNWFVRCIDSTKDFEYINEFNEYDVNEYVTQEFTSF